MKAINRILTGCMLLATCAPALHAQKMTTVSGNISRTEQLKSSRGSHPFWWIVRAGYVQTFCDLDKYSYKDASDGISKSGYNFSIGFQKQFNDFGLYYGLDLGVDKTLAPYDCEVWVNHSYYDAYLDIYQEFLCRRYDTAFVEAPVIYLRPRFGFCHTISRNWQLDMGVGIGYGYLAADKPEHKSVINGEIDFGFWYRNILMQAAYTPAFTTNDMGRGVNFLQRIAVNVGYRF